VLISATIILYVFYVSGYCCLDCLYTLCRFWTRFCLKLVGPVRRPEGWMKINQTLKMNTSLQLRWNKCSNHKHISERVISWLQNVPNTHMRPTKQTDRKFDTKKFKTVQYSIINKCCFQQYEIMFLDSKLDQTNSDWDEILHTHEQISFQDLPKFWAQSDLWITHRFKNTARNWVGVF
jgi:hypothetical protein